MSKSVCVFEHQSLKVKEGNLTENEFDSLVRFNDRTGNKYFTAGHKKITFKNYVGLIQVGKLTVQILPKADKEKEQDVNCWKSALIQMLFLCRYLKLESLSNADVKLCNHTLFDLYLEMFLDELESVTSQGLVKKYHTVQENIGYCRGKILFSENVRKNLVHKERFFCEYDSYSYDNIYNQILLKALKIMNLFPAAGKFRHRIKNLESFFPEVRTTVIDADKFRHISYDRNTERYRNALQLAKMIILEYCPGILTGSENVFAILFDMNKLFEEFIFRLLSRGKPEDWSVKRQISKKFWKSDKHIKNIRPDILLEMSDSRKIVIDTKWKIPENDLPGDDDLKQMFVYNQYFGSTESILLYPEGDLGIRGNFFDLSGNESIGNRCSLLGVKLIFQGEKFSITQTQEELMRVVKKYEEEWK